MAILSRSQCVKGLARNLRQAITRDNVDNGSPMRSIVLDSVMYITAPGCISAVDFLTASG